VEIFLGFGPSLALAIDLCLVFKMCNICKGTKIIETPLRTIEVDNEVMVKGTHGYKIKTEKLVSKVGGVDACPKCAENAELEYQLWKQDN